MLGDVDLNGSVDAADASMVLMAYALISTGREPDLTEEQLIASDVNCDEAVDATDASDILAFYAHISTGGEGTLEEFLAKKKN